MCLKVGDFFEICSAVLEGLCSSRFDGDLLLDLGAVAVKYQKEFGVFKYMSMHGTEKCVEQKCGDENLSPELSVDLTSESLLLLRVKEVL